MQEIIHEDQHKEVIIEEQNSFVSLNLALSPAGHLYLYSNAEISETLPKKIADKIHSFFSLSDAVGLLRLGLTNFDTLPLSFSFWQRFAKLFITELCKYASVDREFVISAIPFPVDEINQLIAQAPFIRGIEYFNQETADFIWQNLITALSKELAAFEGKLDDYLSAFQTGWNTVGRVCFHLAENKNNLE